MDRAHVSRSEVRRPDGRIKAAGDHHALGLDLPGQTRVDACGVVDGAHRAGRLPCDGHLSQAKLGDAGLEGVAEPAMSGEALLHTLGQDLAQRFPQRVDQVYRGGTE